jgi:hypothetical protein
MKVIVKKTRKREIKVKRGKLVLHEKKRKGESCKIWRKEEK